jgi:hypothetical protein
MFFAVTGRRSDPVPGPRLADAAEHVGRQPDGG